MRGPFQFSLRRLLFAISSVAAYLALVRDCWGRIRDGLSADDDTPIRGTFWLDDTSSRGAQRSA
jgi:hypothetical protein